GDVHGIAAERSHQPSGANALHEGANVGSQIGNQKIPEERETKRSPGTQRSGRRIFCGRHTRKLYINTKSGAEKAFYFLRGLCGLFLSLAERFWAGGDQRW